MSEHDWHVYVRDPSGVRQGEIDDYTSLDCVPVFNDIGTWNMTINADASSVPSLVMPNYGIEVVRDGVTVMSGRQVFVQAALDSGNNKVMTFTGDDDNLLLKERNAHPIPTDPAPPYTAQEFDTITGVASTVIRSYVNLNLGPGALSQRRVSGLTIGTDPVVGSSITGNAKWDNLLVFLQTLAVSGGIGFRIASSAADGLVFETYGLVDRSSTLKFSLDLGNLQAYSYSTARPTGNYFYVGGDGDGTARSFQEPADSASIATWGRIEGDMVSSSGTAGGAQMTLDGKEALVNGAEQAVLTVTLVDTPDCQYLDDYNLGDKISIVLATPIRTPYGVIGSVVDTIQSVDINLSHDNGALVTPIVGNAPTKSIAALFKNFKLINKRLSNIERR